MSPEFSGVHFDKLFASIDAMDTESFLGFIAEDCTFRFGSSPPVTGRDDLALLGAALAPLHFMSTCKILFASWAPGGRAPSECTITAARYRILARAGAYPVGWVRSAGRLWA